MLLRLKYQNIEKIEEDKIMSLKGAIKNMASKPGEMVKDVGEKANEFFEVQN